MNANTKLKIVTEPKKTLDAMSIEEIIGRPVFKQKLTPPQFGEAKVDFSNPKHLAKALSKLSQEDAQNNS